jgi:aldehyde dehydrogenase (NAD+)
MLPELIPNFLDGRETMAAGGGTFTKVSPVTGKKLWDVAASGKEDVHLAVSSASEALASWSSTPAVQRGLILGKVAAALDSRRDEFARMVSAETGKSCKDALGEVGGAVQLGHFFASEGQRLYGRTTTSGQANRYAMTVRRPRGVAGLIIAANTPIANVAWKVFPALVCGNTAVLKASEDSPAVAWLFAKTALEAGLPPGVLSVVQGTGPGAGEPLVLDERIRVISFTGSTVVGQRILQLASPRLARVSLELGGKNAFVVCDDANLDNAVKWALLSAFSNAGQRCAAASRIIVFGEVYEHFKACMLEKIEAMTLGPNDANDFGPVIKASQLEKMLAAVAGAVSRGARVLCGGHRLEDAQHSAGFYMTPTLLEGVACGDPLEKEELFGPVASLQSVRDFAHALEETNRSPYGLTAAIHTRNIDRAIAFAEKADVGVVTVNGGTYGSEPHMPFGGTKLSGNGTREPGTEALDVYSELKDIYMNLDPSAL